MTDSAPSTPGIADLVYAPRRVARDLIGKFAVFQLGLIYGLCLWLVWVARGIVSVPDGAVVLPVFAMILMTAFTLSNFDTERMYTFLFALPTVVTGVSGVYMAVGVFLAHSQVVPSAATAVIASTVLAFVGFLLALLLRPVRKRISRPSREEPVEKSVLGDDYENFEEL